MVRPIQYPFSTLGNLRNHSGADLDFRSACQAPSVDKGEFGLPVETLWAVHKDCVSQLNRHSGDAVSHSKLDQLSVLTLWSVVRILTLGPNYGALSQDSQVEEFLQHSKPGQPPARPKRMISVEDF